MWCIHTFAWTYYLVWYFFLFSCSIPVLTFQFFTKAHFIRINVVASYHIAITLVQAFINYTMTVPSRAKSSPKIRIFYASLATLSIRFVASTRLMRESLYSNRRSLNSTCHNIPVRLHSPYFWVQSILTCTKTSFAMLSFHHLDLPLYFALLWTKGNTLSLSASGLPSTPRASHTYLLQHPCMIQYSVNHYTLFLCCFSLTPFCLFSIILTLF